MAKVSEVEGKRMYPHLAGLFDCWFNRDVDVYGNSLDEVLMNYRSEESFEERMQVAAEIRRFISQYHLSDEALSSSVEQIFKPDVTIEGWNGMTTRQWLEYVARFIQD